jgi:cell division protein FtsW
MFTTGNLDVTLVFTVLFLIVFGVIMIYSSSYYSSFQEFSDHTYYLKRQLLWSVIGIVAMFVMAKINYKFICKFWFLIYSSSVFFLVLVLFIGKDIKGAKRWLDLGIIGFQPSEFAKLALIIIMAVFASHFVKYLNQWKVVGIHILLILLPTILIGVENMSTAIVLCAIGGSMLFVALPKVKAIIKFILIPVSAITAIVIIFKDTLITLIPEDSLYRLDRIEIFLNGPWSDPQGMGYQTIQSLYAIGSGGLFGKGLGYSIQKNGFIPEAHNDIIFSIICEELGLFGAFALILLFILLIWRCMIIASKAKDMMGFLLVTGIMMQIGFQVIINIAVVTNSIPATGMPLPFISYGGSSLLFLMVEIGIVLNVSRQSNLL